VKLRLYLAIGAILLSGGSSGCEDAGKRPVQARVPALAPTTTAAAQAPPELPVLPLANPAGGRPVSLLPLVPPGKEYLIQKVQEKFASGEQNFKAGHLEAAARLRDKESLAPLVTELHQEVTRAIEYLRQKQA